MLSTQDRACADTPARPQALSLADAPAAARPALAGLIWTLVRTDFKARYHGTISGFVWALLKPLTMFVVLTSVFSLIFPDDETYKLDLIIGLFLWEFFAEGTRNGLMSLHARGFLLSKARFPSWILVVTSLSNPLLTVTVFSTVLLAFLAITGRAPGLGLVGLFLFYLLALAAIVAGISLAASVLFLRYRDLNQVWDMATQAGFFFAPIIYPLAVIPERYHFYLYAWPPTAAIEFARAVLVDRRAPSLLAHVELTLVAVTVLAAGSGIYRRYAPRVREYV